MAASFSKNGSNGISREEGFTLIEVMFAAVYLAVGLLAIAAMQDIAIGRATDAKRLTVATNVATEMIERVRYNSPANSTATLGQYPYNGITACSDLTACPGGETAGNSANNVTALSDYNDWRSRLKATDAAGLLMLPGAVGTVTSTMVDLVNNTTGAAGADGVADMGQVQVTVTVKWATGIRTPTITMSTIVAPL